MITLTNEELINVTFKENMVIVHYSSEESCNYDLGSTALKYNWYTVYVDKIAYIFQDNDNIVITIGVDAKETFKDDNGNIKEYIKRPGTIQDMEILEVLTVTSIFTMTFSPLSIIVSIPTT